MKKIIIMITAVFMMALTANAENLIVNGDAESNLDNWSTTLELSTDNPHAGKASFNMLDSVTQSKELMAVDTAKKYQLSGWFKTANNKSATILIGLISYDADKRLIHSQEVAAVAKTETKLVEDCVASDTVIKVSDASQWKEGENYSVAFDADDSGNYNDLPNKNMTAVGKISVKQVGAIWEVTLPKPCGKTAAVGTVVRQHRNPPYTYPYVVRSDGFDSMFWSKLTGNITGMSQTTSPGDKFWHGTKYVRIIILSLNGGLVLFDDLKLEEVAE